MAGTMEEHCGAICRVARVSMESGLDGRNNDHDLRSRRSQKTGLNGVRPRWPEQSAGPVHVPGGGACVSMESGLDGRNNRGVKSQKE